MAIDKNAIIKDAQKFLAKGQFDKAIAEWKKILKESPNDPNIYNTIGDLCIKKDSRAEAVEAYNKAADILAADGFTSKAIALFKKVLNIDPKKIEAHLALGDLNAEKGLTGNALESYKIAADYYTQQKQTARALDIYQKMADLNPSNVAFNIKLGDMYANEGMKEKSAKAYLSAADGYLSKNDFKDARHLFEKILALDPGNKEVYYKAGIVYFKEGKFVEACKALKPAFENDPSNRELFDLYLEALGKAGKDVEAEQAIRKLLAENPDNADLREKLYNLYLAKKDFEKALIEAVTLADGKIESGHAEEAEEIYKNFAAGSPYFPPIRQKLAEFYISISRPRDAAAELLQAAELFITEGDLQSARGVLTQAIEIAPDMPEAGDRLEQLQTAATAAPPEEPELIPAEEPVPVVTSPVVIEPEPLPVVETPAAAPAPVQVQAPAPAPAPAATASAPPIAEALVPEEDPSVIEAFTEADVLIKYGLADKAAEQLETLRGNFPDNPRIPVKLRDIYREQGNIDKAVQHALFVVALYSKSGREDQAAAALQETYEMAPDHPAVLSKLGRAPLAQTESVQDTPGEVLQPAVIQDHLETPPAEPEISPPPPEEIIAEAIAPPKSVQSDEIEFALGSELPPLEEPWPEDSVPDAEPSLIERRPVEEEPPAAEEPFSAEPFSEEQPSVEKELAGTPKQAAHEPSAEVNFGETWAEAEFYFQQGLFDEAKKHYNKIIALSPGNERASARLAEIAREENELKEFAKLTDAVEELEGYLPPVATGGVLAASPSDDEAVRSLMQEIQQLKQQPASPAPSAIEKELVAPPPQIAADAVSRPLEPAKKAEEEDFFDLGAELQREAAADKQKEAPSEEFFDLAAELSDELGNVPILVQPPVRAEEQSLDDIFQEFKRGIEQQTAKEEVDTHYNLGVAYKEMGLLDDAIGEFLMTSENEPKFVQSRYMLGLCYMEKGEYQNAVSAIRNALDHAESEGFPVANLIGMHFDLGLAYQCAGNTSSAADEFQLVVNEDPGYRDAAVRVKELQTGDFISLEQLKDDIEKEISSKFLEEGVRIEREEKTRKNERVGK